MKDTELKKQRDRALYAVYVNGLEQGRFASMREAGRYACKQPAPRFFIEAEKASILVGRIMAKVSLIDLNSNSRRRVWQLYFRYRHYLSEHPGCKLSRERVLEEIVMEPAPEFYLEPQQARKILQREIKKVRQRWMQQE